MAYVPDLGKDLIREFWYDKQCGKIGCEMNKLPSGLATGRPDGPRYLEFHPKFSVVYVINELSSTVSFDDLFYFCECNIRITSFANIIMLLFLH